MKAPISILRPDLNRQDGDRTGFGRLSNLIAPKQVDSSETERRAGPPPAVERAIAGARLREMEASFDPIAGLVLCNFKFANRPSFTRQLLEDIGTIQDIIIANEAEGRADEVRYVAWASKTPGIWNLGGDLDLFAQLIRAQDRDALLRYAFTVVGEGYRNHLAFDLPLVTVSLVQGDALGGGFEAALSSNVIIAERRARFGLPEVLFNLFPGMGAYTYLSRRITPGIAERMILSGRIYSAAELYEMGVVDILCEDCGGHEALYAFMSRNEQRHRMQRAVYSARRRINPITRKELEDIAASWVDLALQLSDRDLRVMNRLVAAQDRRRQA